MNDYQSISDVIEHLRRDYDWAHSFIRECYFTTLHNMCEFEDDLGETVVGDVDGPKAVRLTVAAAGNQTNTGIEFLFRDVTVFSLQAFEALSFTYEYSRNSGHLVCFSSNESNRQCYINAQSVTVRFLGRSYLGVDQLLGHEFPTSESYEAVPVEGCWRQCENCSNAWEENPKITFSRCPDCGEVTKLSEKTSGE